MVSVSGKQSFHLNPLGFFRWNLATGWIGAVCILIGLMISQGKTAGQKVQVA